MGVCIVYSVLIIFIRWHFEILGILVNVENLLCVCVHVCVQCVHLWFNSNHSIPRFSELNVLRLHVDSCNPFSFSCMSTVQLFFVNPIRRLFRTFLLPNCDRPDINSIIYTINQMYTLTHKKDAAFGCSLPLQLQQFLFKMSNLR